ncbi:hypothetical protein K470DRAFT_73401 [Piedraia hortae CBS 480.64]|uniref:CID domain-containing protein n=1 Tax=Piedraia hortae CBS 480.64 TaxID=1314780 RepID=A0A6A7C040_9PEZI|nr:hypothetical protein K470DRAFT_73401 [Piedraia hortae CBS 480.64]
MDPAFPDVSSKLAAPKKRSAFEKERQAAEAKRRRAEAENAAALKAFEDDFADDAPANHAAAPPKRKRALDEARELQHDRAKPLTAIVAPADHEVEAPKPAVQLSSLPPNYTERHVQELLQDSCKIHSIEFRPGMAARRSRTAVAILSTDAGEVDAAVVKLRDKYLGCGYYLSIARHLASSTARPRQSSPEPFGAERQSATSSFAPPEAYHSTARRQPKSELIVSVQPPFDMSTVRAIHVLVEKLLLQTDPMRALELEATLMALPSVQMDERMAFLYDSQSPAGIYYRHLLWTSGSTGDPQRPFSDTNFTFRSSEVPFANLASLREAITHKDYDSSEEEGDSDSEAEQRPAGRKRRTPLKMARLTFLLSRLPTTNAKLRRGDVARVTHFAVAHAATIGADAIVDLLLLNVEKPFAFSRAARYEQDDELDDADDYDPEVGVDLTAAPTTNASEDPSNAKLIGLYLISDLLSCSSTAGAKDAWKFRSFFETALVERRTFVRLGQLAKKLAWGKLKAELWRRKVAIVLDIWEGWSVFDAEVLRQLREHFDGGDDREEREERFGPVHAQEQMTVPKARFKRVDSTTLAG